MTTTPAASRRSPPDAVLPSVVKEVVVALPPDDAFRLFTSQMSRWWPMATHSCFTTECQRIEIEQRPGGSVTEVARDGRRASWGAIVDWDPPRRFSMTWHPGNDAALATLVEVSFEPARAEACNVRLVHSGWHARGEGAAAVRDGYDHGWDTVLQRYAGSAARDSGPEGNA